jgi:hypothetical protein
LRNKFQEIGDFIRTLYYRPTGLIPLNEPVFIDDENIYLEEDVESAFVRFVAKFVDLFEEKMVD